MSLRSPAHAHTDAILEIDLDAICTNWRALGSRIGGTQCAAVVKADAYGLGALQVAAALYRAGCRHFFVAHLDEGIALRPALPDQATIYVLHGSPAGAESACVAHNLVPVLNSLPRLAAWQAMARRLGKALPAVLQVDTGMARLGLAAPELDRVAGAGGQLEGLDLRLIMSHLVSAEDPSSPLNRLQLDRFRAALRRLPPRPASLANSSGIFLGTAFHFDLARPGAALYGIAPTTGMPNPLQAVIRLRGKVIQTRDVEAGTGVGYNHNWTAARRARIATVATGYADGYLRSLGNRGEVHFEGTSLPVVGNVSMDTITIDVSAVAQDRLHEGSLIDLAGPLNTVDAIAARAGTIGYEILTGLGSRYARHYLGAATEPDPLRATAIAR